MSGLARFSVEGEFRIGWQLIPPFHTLLDKDSKQAAQSPISHFCLAVGLGMARDAKVELSAYLPPQSEPKMAEELVVPMKPCSWGYHGVL